MANLWHMRTYALPIYRFLRMSQMHVQNKASSKKAESLVWKPGHISCRSIISTMMSLQVTCASLFAGTLLIAWLLHWVYRWRNPPCKGISPPGSMGLPIVGESIQFFKTSYSLDIPDFYKLRLKR
jgi:hypothetical protein